MSNSTQHKLSRIRPPRVQITYDLEIGDAIVMKELPMVVGILGDYSGHRKTELPPLKNRKFLEIDRDNFNDIMESLAPHLALSVPNKLSDEGGNIKVELDFKEIDDFHPASIVQQVEPLRKLFEARQRLVDLFVKLDGNDELEALLQKVMTSEEDMQKIKSLTASTESSTEDSADTAASDDKA